MKPLAIAILVGFVVGSASGQGTDLRGIEELNLLRPHLMETCALVREDPRFWPVRSFPHGPLGLEVRRGTAPESERLRNIHIGMAAAACGVPKEMVTIYFFCGPDCPRNRRDHLVRQLAKVRDAVAAFNALRGVRLVSVWAPRGEVRVNDVFVLDGKVREAIPSPKMGLVPSGEWRSWRGLAAYLSTIGIREADIQALETRMLDIGLSAFVRSAGQVRAVAVGVSDNESGLLFVAHGGLAPRVGEVRPDGSRYEVVEEISKGVFFYETT